MFIRRNALIALGASLLFASIAPASALYMVMRHGREPVSQEMADQHGFSDELRALVNLPSRSECWEPFFSECPNDVLHFGFRFKGTQEVNQLLERVNFKGKDRVTLLLSPEPSYHWDQEDQTPYDAHFVLGSQKILDEWWKELPDGRFGVHVYPKPPAAVAPTLALFVGSGHVNLAQLRVPKGSVVLDATSEEDRMDSRLSTSITEIRRFLKDQRR